MNPYIQIIRPVNCIMSAFAVYIAAIISGAIFFGTYPTIEFTYALLTTFLVCAGGMVVNDIFDIEADKINKPKRPLPSGKIKVRTAKTYAAILFIIGVAISYFINNLYRLYILLLYV